MEPRRYDRTAEDLGNIVNLGHLNLGVGDQLLSTVFYVTGLGLTRDPYINTGIGNMWVNVGMSQFHLPTGKAERFRGVTGLVMPDRAALLDRLAQVRKALDGTDFDFRESNDAVETVCPWGNRIRCHDTDERRFGPVSLGMAYLDFTVRPGTAAGIARFYRDIIGAHATVTDADGTPCTHVAVGAGQEFLFRETDAPEAPYDGHHVQIYVCDFSEPYDELLKRNLIFQESSQHQYRFKDIVDLDTGAVLHTIDHEVRSMQHPLYGRALVNRDPAQDLRRYRPGRDDRPWSLA